MFANSTFLVFFVGRVLVCAFLHNKYIYRLGKIEIALRFLPLVVAGRVQIAFFV